MRDTPQPYTVDKRELFRFALAGVIGFGVDAAALLGLIQWCGWGPYGAKLGSFFLAVCTTWWINRHYAFAGRSRVSRDFPGPQEAPMVGRHLALLQEWVRYVSANAVGGVVNNGVYWFGISVLSWLYRYPVVAVALGSLVGMAFNFYASSVWVFRKNREKP